MLEKLWKFGSGVRKEQDTAIGGLMIFQILQDKKQIKAEETFAARIEVAIRLREIQFVSQYPKDPPEEPIDIRFAKFAGFEDQGYAIFLVVKPEWLRKARRSGDQAEREYFYGKLKLTLQVIDELRRQGGRVLNNDEIQEILRKQGDQKQADPS